MLILPIKKKWFDMIKSEEKKEEYREIKPYYNIRFKICEIVFRNGYSSKSPKIRCYCTLRVGQGKEEWGAEPNKEYYILDILEVCK